MLREFTAKLLLPNLREGDMSLRTKKDTFDDIEGIFEQAHRQAWEEM